MIIIASANIVLGVGGTADEAIEDYARHFGIPMDIAVESVRRPDVIIAKASKELWDDDGYLPSDWILETEWAQRGDGKKIR